MLTVIELGLVKGWWAETDLNHRPLARKANVLTRLDDRPTRAGIEIAFVNIRVLFLRSINMAVFGANRAQAANY